MGGTPHKFMFLYCQAQPKLQVKHSLKAELALFSVNGRRPQLFGKMEDDLNFWAKWKTTSILKVMEDDLNVKGNGRRHKYFR